ncbi:hypothetical protein D9757_005069 [Collybiopsis confluens]|uniref:Uncharacterized protein n=1 Tax=Collybiopsis confluens TaxID=2823264 RepID=A0A8H5HT31_9AGAR|nr:hypothetical protein D9757_005069 [Collybiopsis confluens]
MALRAHILRDNFSVDSSRPVTLETLDALGWKIVSSGNSEDPEEAAKRIAQDWGFPVTHAGSIVPFDLSPAAANFSQVESILSVVAQKKSYAYNLESLALLKSGNISLDLEDPVSKNWIRFELGPGQGLGIPAGCKFRPHWNNQSNKGPIGIWLLNGDVSNVRTIAEEELDMSAIHQAYLTSIKAI